MSASPPESQAHGPMGMAKLRASLTDLEERMAVVEPAALRGVRQRKLFFALGVLMVIGLVISTWLIIALFMARANSRAYYNDQNVQQNRQLRDLACVIASFRPPGDNEGDGLRDRYHCPDYQYPPPNRPTTGASS